MHRVDAPQVTQNSPLPETAPLVRLTAGFGTAGQKTWNLRRPVTLIGSRRPAHIVLHNPGIDKAHCVIVNTATTVLLRDLHTESGCQVNSRRADPIVELKDGDVITVGETELTIGIELPHGAAGSTPKNGAQHDPTRLGKPVAVCHDGADTVWRVDEAVAVIGRHENATVRLQHPNISTRHAVLFTFKGEPALFDTGSRNGVWVNGERCTFASLTEADRVLIGPFGLIVTSPDAAALRNGGDARRADGSCDATGTHAQGPLGDDDSVLRSPFAIWQHASQAKPDTPNPAHATDDWKSLVSSLEDGASDAWERLHVLPASHGTVDPDARAESAADGIDSIAPEASVKEREAELARREEQLRQRERALTQKWTQFLSAKCPNCGRPVATPEAAAG